MNLKIFKMEVYSCAKEPSEGDFIMVNEPQREQTLAQMNSDPMVVHETAANKQPEELQFGIPVVNFFTNRVEIGDH